MKRSDFVVYIDRKSKEHNAQVVNVVDYVRLDPVYKDGMLDEPSKIVPLDPPILDIAYVNDDGVTVTEFGLHHHTSPALDETNTYLPRYVLNCWKNIGEEHKAPKSDHPIFDHPYATPQLDQEGHRIPISRPKTDADVTAHLGAVEAGELCGGQERAETPAVVTPPAEVTTADPEVEEEDKEEVKPEVVN